MYNVSTLCSLHGICTGEADLVLHHIKKLRNGGVQDKDIAVIAPYSLQVCMCISN